MNQIVYTGLRQESYLKCIYNGFSRKGPALKLNAQLPSLG